MRGNVNYTRFSAHTLVAKRLDITGRIVYSKATSRFNFIESFTGRNFNPRVTGWPPTPPAATPNILNLGKYDIVGSTRRPNTLGDIGVTLLATDKLRISDTFRVEDFTIDGTAVFSDFFSITRGAGATLRTDTSAFSNLDGNRITKYRKYQNTLEADYQFNNSFGFHLGYRYGNRHIEESFEGFNLGSNGSFTPPAVALRKVRKRKTTPIRSSVDSKRGRQRIGASTSTLNTVPQTTFSPVSGITTTQISESRAGIRLTRI